MCQKAWELIYHVCHATTLRAVREVKLGDLKAHVRNKKAAKKLTKEAFVQSWMDVFFKRIADQMPDSNGREKQHLPEWMTRKWIFAEFLKDESTIKAGTYLAYTHIKFFGMSMSTSISTRMGMIPNATASILSRLVAVL